MGPCQSNKPNSSKSIEEEIRNEKHEELQYVMNE